MRKSGYFFGVLLALCTTGFFLMLAIVRKKGKEC